MSASKPPQPSDNMESDYNNANDRKMHGKKHRKKRGKFIRFTPHLLVAVTVTATLRIVFANTEDTLTSMQLHVILAVVGYQVLMGHGTLLVSTMAHKDVFFFPNTNKKRLHWVTQSAGALSALAATVVIYRSRENHFHSIHGILGLVSLALTAISSLNGVVFLYWEELGIPKRHIKFLHTVTGALTFILSTVCLCYGYNKRTFHRWSSPPVAYLLTAVAVASVLFFALSPARIVLNWFRPKNEEMEKNEKDGGEEKLKNV